VAAIDVIATNVIFVETVILEEVKNRYCEELDSLHICISASLHPWADGKTRARTDV
jgi:hypothetical protein